MADLSHRKRGFVMLWYSLLDDPGFTKLRPIERCLAIYALKLADQIGKGGALEVSPRGLCMAARVNPKSGTKAVQTLVRNGFLFERDLTPNSTSNSTPKSSPKVSPLLAVTPDFITIGLRRRGAEEGRNVREDRGLREEGRERSKERSTTATPRPKRAAIIRGAELIRDFSTWYAGYYGRPLSAPTDRDKILVGQLLSRVDGDKAQVKFLAADTAEKVVATACQLAVKAQLFFVRPPNSLDLRRLVGGWQQVWDNLLRMGQQQGVMPHGLDGNERLLGWTTDPANGAGIGAATLRAGLPAELPGRPALADHGRGDR